MQAVDVVSPGSFGSYTISSSDSTPKDNPEDYYTIQLDCYGKEYPAKIKKDETVKFCNKCYGRGHKGLVHHPMTYKKVEEDQELTYPNLCNCVRKKMYVPSQKPSKQVIDYIENQEETNE